MLMLVCSNIRVAFADKNGISILALPKRYHKRLENDIELIIEHEIIHLVLRFRFGLAISRQFDNVCPFIGDI